jgi:hypothetical protein
VLYINKAKFEAFFLFFNHQNSIRFSSQDLNLPIILVVITIHLGLILLFLTSYIWWLIIILWEIIKGTISFHNMMVQTSEEIWDILFQKRNGSYTVTSLRSFVFLTFYCITFDFFKERCVFIIINTYLIHYSWFLLFKNSIRDINW